MPNRLQVRFLLVLLNLFFTVPTFSQTENLESFAIKPGQAVYIIAVKGECGGAIQPGMMLVNGRPSIVPGNSSLAQDRSQRQTLEYYEPIPKVAELIGQTFSQNKTFVVVDTPEKADFIFRVCATYTDDVIHPEMIKRMNLTTHLEFAEARVIPSAIYRANKENINAPMWKAKTPDDQRPLNNKPDGKKKKKEKPPTPQQGTLIINGVQMNLAQASKQPADIDDLTNYFWQDYAKLAPVKTPKLQRTIKPPDDQQNRPFLANKPEDAAAETLRPVLRNQVGEPVIAAKEM